MVWLKSLQDGHSSQRLLLQAHDLPHRNETKDVVFLGGLNTDIFGTDLEEAKTGEPVTPTQNVIAEAEAVEAHR